MGDMVRQDFGCGGFRLFGQFFFGYQWYWIYFVWKMLLVFGIVEFVVFVQYQFMIGCIFDYLWCLYYVVISIVIVEDCYDYFVIGVDIFEVVEYIGGNVEDVVFFQYYFVSGVLVVLKEVLMVGKNKECFGGMVIMQGVLVFGWLVGCINVEIVWD